MFTKLLNQALILLAKATGQPLAKLHTVRGFPVALTNTRADITNAVVLERLAAALDLIAAYQPTRFAHLQRDVRRIVVERSAHRGEYRRAERAIMTELTFLARRDISAAIVASSVLHEGVHARIHRLAPNLAGCQMAREERLCRKAELYFGRALPHSLGSPVIERAQESLALSDEDIAPRASLAEQRAAIERVDRASARDHTASPAKSPAPW